MRIINYIFKPTIPPKETGPVFIVEDNISYAQALQVFIKSNFPHLNEVKIFPVGEIAELELEKNPSLIIMDYFLNSKYDDAENGLEAVKHIRAKRPETNIMLLSSQDDVAVALEATKKYKCHYIKKDETAFGKVEEYMRKLF
jgi:two-component system, OmpR family, response regulator